MTSTFSDRHLGPRAADIDAMLAALGCSSLDELADRAVPDAIRDHDGLDLPPALSEQEALARLAELADANTRRTPLIGMGFHGTVTPSVILRNVLEDPGWYTAYTPYQPEISQGRLEALLVFQTMIADLTGLPVANASLLDEASAAAEAMALCRRRSRAPGDVYVVDPDCHPQTLGVLRTRAEPIGVRLVVGDPAEAGDEAFGALLQYPGSSGQIRDLRPAVEAVHAAGGLVAVAADPLALALLTPPGELGADIAVGSTQRFGVPLWYGGPHAAYIAVREGLERALPGRMVGVSVDAAGREAYRLALQAREQHIRRDRATSNICTAQVLLAVTAAMYAVYHGAEGLRGIAERVNGHTARFAAALEAAGHEVETTAFFDAVTVRVPDAEQVHARARAQGLDLRAVDPERVGVAFDETTTDGIVADALAAFGVDGPDAAASGADASGQRLPASLRRDSAYLTHPVFSEHRSETQMMRFLRRLRDSDLALNRAMIPLGSCTMKLNPATAMRPISWDGFAGIHPYVSVEDAPGYRRLIADLEGWLAEVTGYDAVSLQPNAGSQGEFAGLLAIRRYLQSVGEGDRDVCLVPESAHGTNAASAVIAGMRVAIVACDEDGNVSLDDLRAKLEEHAGRVAAIMVTYPSTHGVFEADIRELCELVHEAGGQVYLDGANLNAMLGLAKPGRFGADVSHLNLHKTFSIPHGGGGPGVGPVAVRSHLAPFLPSGANEPDVDPLKDVGPIAAAPWGSAGVLPISWAYIAMSGAEGLTRATQVAVLAANYVAARLDAHYPVLYRGPGGLVAHECILDLRPLTQETGVTAEDVAKRLIDYGFHAPTMSFPVAGTLMVEPTESESKAELDRFCDAMIAIRAEIEQVATGAVALDSSPLRHAPHPAVDVLADDWDRPYARSAGAYPPGVDPADKYWPPVSRIDNAHGDRNLVCACPLPEDLAD